MLSPGAPPTAKPPPTRTTSSHLKNGNMMTVNVNNGSGVTVAAPPVTNPMYIIEKPSKSKNKTKGNSHSDCKTQ